MAVLSQNVGRMDFEIHRGVVESIGAQWQQQIRGEPDVVPVDLSADSATFELTDKAGNVLYSQSCVTTSNGCAFCTIPDNAFTDNKWIALISGNWKITVTHNGQKTLLGWGNYLLV